MEIFIHFSFYPLSRKQSSGSYHRDIEIFANKNRNFRRTDKIVIDDGCYWCIYASDGFSKPLGRGTYILKKFVRRFVSQNDGKLCVAT